MQRKRHSALTSTVWRFASRQTTHVSLAPLPLPPAAGPAMLLLDASSMLLQEGPGWSSSGGALGVVDRWSTLRPAGVGGVAQAFFLF